MRHDASGSDVGTACLSADHAAAHAPSRVPRSRTAHSAASQASVVPRYRYTRRASVVGVASESRCTRRTSSATHGRRNAGVCVAAYTTSVCATSACSRRSATLPRSVHARATASARRIASVSVARWCTIASSIGSASDVGTRRTMRRSARVHATVRGASCASSAMRRVRKRRPTSTSAACSLSLPHVCTSHATCGAQNVVSEAPRSAASSAASHDAASSAYAAATVAHASGSCRHAGTSDATGGDAHACGPSSAASVVYGPQGRGGGALAAAYIARAAVVSRRTGSARGTYVLACASVASEPCVGGVNGSRPGGSVASSTASSTSQAASEARCMSDAMCVCSTRSASVPVCGTSCARACSCASLASAGDGHARSRVTRCASDAYGASRASVASHGAGALAARSTTTSTTRRKRRALGIVHRNATRRTRYVASSASSHARVVACSHTRAWSDGASAWRAAHRSSASHVHDTRSGACAGCTRSSHTWSMSGASYALSVSATCAYVAGRLCRTGCGTARVGTTHAASIHAAIGSPMRCASVRSGRAAQPWRSSSTHSRAMYATMRCACASVHKRFARRISACSHTTARSGLIAACSPTSSRMRSA